MLDKLQVLYNTLDAIEVKGRNNMSRLLSSIMLVDKLMEELKAAEEEQKDGQNPDA